MGSFPLREVNETEDRPTLEANAQPLSRPDALPMSTIAPLSRL